LLRPRLSHPAEFRHFRNQHCSIDRPPLWILADPPWHIDAVGGRSHHQGPIYLACKEAFPGLTRGHARELGKQGVRVNTVLPRWVMTERQIKLWLTPAGEAEIERARCLSPRLQPEGIAAMVLYLAYHQAHMCTSQDFIVDGGWV
jgi:NAD(P)-dependent dehydrogenase (short-subunit alcohol dehydrogenase family)